MTKRVIKFLLIFVSLVVLVFIAAFIYLSSLVKKHVRLYDQPVEEIVLVNIGNGDRQYIAELINECNKCHPSIIGLNILLPKFENNHKDSLLMESISRSSCIILAKHQSIGFYGTNKRFADVAIGQGFSDLIIDDHFVTGFYLYRFHKNKKDYSLAYQLAYHFDNKAAVMYLGKETSQPQTSVISSLRKDFKFYDFKDNNFDCSLMRDNIVLLGYLGPTQEDKFRTYSWFSTEQNSDDKWNMYGTEIIANQILMILRGLE